MYWATGILGLMFAGAPYVLGYSDNTLALWSSLLIGGAVFAVSLIEGLRAGKERWEYWTAIALGLAAVAAPFVLGFNAQTTAMLTTAGAGLLIAGLAGARLITGRSSKT